MTPPSLIDSRRVPGPSILWDRPCVVLDVSVGGRDAPRAVAAWQKEIDRILPAIGWEGERTCFRTFPGGATLALSAPLDVLYAATEVNEWAWDAAASTLASGPAHDLEAAAKHLTTRIASSRNPRLVALGEAAEARGVAFLHDSREISVGLGAGSLTWPVSEIPDPASVPWTEVHDVPVALVTGTNGKTTTVRLLAAMIRASGRIAGISSTDGVEVGGERIATGDYSGPEGARSALRDRRVAIAVLETARGGILRRGLPVRRAQAALVTNVAEDHLGEFGIHDLDALADVKFVVSRAVQKHGSLVLNADDPALVARAAGAGARLAWFGLDRSSDLVKDHVRRGGLAAVLEGKELVILSGGVEEAVATVDEIPITFGGAARHNVANALGALAVGSVLDLPRSAMASALREFRGTAEENPGRANLFDLGGVRVLLDFAHNPHGLRALLETAFSLPAARRLVLLGQAGDRDDASIRELARIAWEFRPDHVLLKEMPKYRRGRAEGEITGLMEDELRRGGARPNQIAHAPTEIDAVRKALDWSRAGDLLVLTIHSNREEALSLLSTLRDARWTPGQDLSQYSRS